MSVLGLSKKEKGGGVHTGPSLVKPVGFLGPKMIHKRNNFIGVLNLSPFQQPNIHGAVIMHQSTR